MFRIFAFLCFFCVTFHLSAIHEGNYDDFEIQEECLSEFDEYIDFEGAVEPPSRQEKFLLITGCPRSGTHYISNLIRACGVDFPHERMGKFGCASWPMCIDSNIQVWGPCARGYQFQHVLHQVRNPLLVMSSVYTQEIEKTWNYIYHCIPEINPQDPLFVRTAAFWYYWNLAAEKRAEYTYRVEDIDNVFEGICIRLGINYNKEALNRTQRDANKHRTPYKIEYTWAQLKAELPEDLFNKIQEMAHRYGYPIVD